MAQSDSHDGGRASTSAFTPHGELLEARARLLADVDDLLAALARGVLPSDTEREHVDCKEEAGRRGRGGVLLPGEVHNLAAAEQLAREVACCANTPGGGALVVGVEDKTGSLLGAGMDVDWLRHRIYQRVDVAPAIEERFVRGVRLLVVLVAEAREPVEDPDGRLVWRTGATCQPVDRAEWWLHRRASTGSDPMAAPTDRILADVTEGALLMARNFLRESASEHETGVPRSASELLSYLGVLLPDGRLTQAGAIAFCASDRSWISTMVVDVEGGDVLAAARDLTGLSLVEQVAATEQRLDAANTAVTLRVGFSEEPIRRLPPRAVREAVLNGVVHRDWMSPEPVAVRWTEADSALDVVSPGGFVGGVNADNALTQRYARSPALADLFRALRLVERGGMGVDRMVREMVVLGHRRPLLVELDGPYVQTRLVGGRPVVPVVDLVSRIQPAVRRRDVKVALVVDTLLHQPFVTAAQLTGVLQRPEAACAEALDAASECRVVDQPLLRAYKDVWMLSDAAIDVIEPQPRSTSTRRDVLGYRRPADATPLVRRWFEVHSRITSGDHAAMTGLTVAAARRQLERLATEGLLQRGDAMGRNAHFTAAAVLHDD